MLVAVAAAAAGVGAGATGAGDVRCGGGTGSVAGGGAVVSWRLQYYWSTMT